MSADADFALICSLNGGDMEWPACAYENPMIMSLFPPTREEALARIASVRPAEYARSRNALTGAVTKLSPYITHGFVSLPEVLSGVRAQHAVHSQDKFLFELGWREYYRHVWQHRGDGIFKSLHEGVMPDDAYRQDMPLDILHACTGVLWSIWLSKLCMPQAICTTTHGCGWPVMWCIYARCIGEWARTGFTVTC
jgi:hypothetical protein